MYWKKRFREMLHTLWQEACFAKSTISIAAPIKWSESFGPIYKLQDTHTKVMIDYGEKQM